MPDLKYYTSFGHAEASQRTEKPAAANPKSYQARGILQEVFMALSGAIRIWSPRSDSFEADIFSLTSRRTSAR